jgi:hypothetical protein
MPLGDPVGAENSIEFIPPARTRVSGHRVHLAESPIQMERRGCRRRSRSRRIHVERAMGPVTVVVRDISAQYGLEMAESKDEDVVEAVAPQRPHKPLRDRVRKRCPDRRADDLGAFGPEYLVEAARILRVAVPD